MNAESKRAWLKYLRELEGPSQTAVANAAGIDLSYYQRIEYGERNPSLPVAKRIADFLEFPMTWFVEPPDNLPPQSRTMM